VEESAPILLLNREYLPVDNWG